VPAPLERVANHEKKMPANFIRADGYGITAACRRYLEPLIVGEAPPPYRASGVPDYFVPRLKAVRKRLPAFDTTG
jgi:6-phosphofructokinase 1